MLKKKVKYFYLILLILFNINLISSITLDDTLITSNGLNSTINVSNFLITFDKLEVFDYAITFTNLVYTNPLSCNLKESNYPIYNYTTKNEITELPKESCTEEGVTQISRGGGGSSNNNIIPKKNITDEKIPENNIISQENTTVNETVNATVNEIKTTNSTVSRRAILIFIGLIIFLLIMILIVLDLLRRREKISFKFEIFFILGSLILLGALIFFSF